MNLILNFFTNVSFRVLLIYRLGNKISSLKGGIFFRFLLLRLRYVMLKKWGCDISFNAIIGENLFLPHPNGIIIGDSVEIHDNVVIYQNVTIGAKNRSDKIVDYPVIGNSVTIFPNSVVIGKIKIGNNSVVGAGSIVIEDVPPYSTVVGNPAKIIIKQIIC